MNYKNSTCVYLSQRPQPDRLRDKRHNQNLQNSNRAHDTAKVRQTQRLAQNENIVWVGCIPSTPPRKHEAGETDKRPKKAYA